MTKRDVISPILLAEKVFNPYFHHDWMYKLQPGREGEI